MGITIFFLLLGFLMTLIKSECEDLGAVRCYTKFLEAEISGCKCCMPMEDSYKCVQCHKTYDGPGFDSMIFEADLKSCVPLSAYEGKFTQNGRVKKMCNKNCLSCILDENREPRCIRCSEEYFLPYKRYCIRYPYNGAIFNLEKDPNDVNQGFKISELMKTTEECQNSCLYCESNLRCKECTYKKVRMLESGMNNFGSDVFSGQLNCEEYPDRIADPLNIVYYVRPSIGNEGCKNSLYGNCNNRDDPTTYMIDLLDVILDLAENRKIYEYNSANIQIYLMKDGSLPHFLSYKSAGFSIPNYYNVLWKLRLFERVKSEVEIRSALQKDCVEWGLDLSNCYLDNESPLLYWNNPNVFVFVNQKVLIKGIKFNGHGMFYANEERENPCTYSHSPCCPAEPCVFPGAVEFSHETYSRYYISPPGGLFSFEFWPDVLWTKAPQLIIEDCEFNSFYANRLSVNLICFSARAGALLLKNSMFDKNFFTMGLISNEAFDFVKIMSKMRKPDNLDYYGGYTCKDIYQKQFQGDCTSLEITGCSFSNYNPGPLSYTSGPYTLSTEGAIVYLRDFPGSVTIRGNTFKNIISSVRLLDNGGCKLPTTSYESSDSFKNDELYFNKQHIIDITASSRYKIKLDKHARLLNEDSTLGRKIGSIIYLREVSLGLNIISNTFDSNIVQTGAVFIEGFKKTEDYPLIIQGNVFKNNFVLYYALSIVILRNSRDLIELNCYGISITDNQFQQNIGCNHVFGNVIVSCENNGAGALSCTDQQNIGCWRTFYSTYVPSAGEQGEKIDTPNSNTEGYLHKRWEFGFDFLKTKIESAAEVYVPAISKSVGKYKIVFSGNTCDQNYAILSNCVYVQGAAKVEISNNVISQNSIPTYNNLVTLGSSLAPFYFSKFSPQNDLMTFFGLSFTLMMESSPVLVRFAGSVSITKTTFENNKAEFSGDFYFGGSVTLDNLLGFSRILLDSNTHKNHEGFYKKGLAVPLISFSYFYKGLSVWNVPYSTLHKTSGAPYNNEPKLEMIGCTVENNHLEIIPYRAYTYMNYTGEMGKKPTQEKFLNFYDGYPKLQLKSVVLKYYDQNEAEFLSSVLPPPMSSSSDSFVKTNGASLYIESLIIRNNKNPAGLSFFSSYFFDFFLKNSLFQNNRNAENTLIFSGLSQEGLNLGMINFLDETQSYWSVKKNLRLEGNSFKNNYGKILQMYAQADSDNLGNIFISKNNFESNQINSSALMNLYNIKGVHLLNNEFKNNLVKYGAILASGTSQNLYISENKILNSLASVAFCGYFENINGNITIIKFDCQGNSAIDFLFSKDFSDFSLFGISQFPAASVYLVGSSFSINASTFTKNQEVISAFLVLKSTLFLQEFSFQDIQSRKNVNYPRLLWANLNSVVTVSKSVIKNINCTECQKGGLLCTIKSILRMYDTNISFVNALTVPIIYSNSSTVSLEKLNINNVSASGENSVAKILMGTIQIDNCTFFNNSADKYGLFSFSMTTLTIRGSVFRNNYCQKITQNIYIKDAPEASLSGCIFEGTLSDLSSQVEAAYIVAIDSNFSLSDSVLRNGLGKSGALYLSGDSTLYKAAVKSCLFESNTGTQASGALYSNLLTLVENCQFQNNLIRGSALATILTENSVQFTILNSQFSDYSGRALAARLVNEVRVQNTSFLGPLSLNQIATRGLNFFSCDRITVSKSNFFNLQDSDTGGAGIFISVLVNVDFNLQISIIDNSFSSLNGLSGGAISVNALNKTIVKGSLLRSSFKACVASAKGGGLYYESANPGSEFKIGDCNFSENKATIGGAFYFKWQPISLVEGTKNIFLFNSAIYGQNFAAYAVKLVQRENVQRSDYNFLMNSTDGSSTQNRRVLQSKAKNSQPVIEQTLGIFTSIQKGRIPPYNFSQVVEHSAIREILNNIRTPEIFNKNSLKESPKGLAGDLVSGQIISPPIIFDLVDEFGQTVFTQNNSYLTVSLLNSSSKFKKGNTFYSINGSFILYPFGVSFYPGEALNIQLETDGVSIVPGRNFPEAFKPTGTVKLSTMMRLCEPNEYYADTDECLKCPENTLNVNYLIKGQDCEACPVGSLCKGSGYVGPMPNFWRIRNNMKRFQKCRNQESCAGAQAGNITESDLSELYCLEKYGEDLSFCLTGFCTGKYIGNLCAKCRHGFALSSDKNCVPCKDNASYYAISVFLILFAIIFIVITVRNALVPPKNIGINSNKSYNKRSLLIKIIVNYFQIVSIISTIDFKWNDEAKASMEYQGRIANSASDVFSIDCMIKGSVSKEQTGTETFFIKLIVIVLLPPILLLISLLVWTLIILFRNRRNHDKKAWHSLRPNLTTTMVIIMFMIHATIVRYSFLAFRCENLGEELEPEYYLEQDLDKKCWEGEHLIWAFVVGLPSLLIWGFGIPAFAFWLLKVNKNILNEQKFQKAYGFLYSGFRRKHYYWEFVILFRKMGMVLCSVFLVSFGVEIQSLAILAISFLSYILQLKYKPFISDDINQLEKVNLLSAFFLVYFSLFFISERLNILSGYIIFVLMVACTSTFLFQWIKLMIQEIVSSKKRRIRPI